MSPTQKNESRTMKPITTSATVYNEQGIATAHNVAIHDFGDTVSIGSTEHNKGDLVIADREISPKGSDEKTMWSVKW